MGEQGNDEVLFEEEQRFRQLWLILLVGIEVVIFWGIPVLQIVFLPKEPLVLAFIFWLLFGVILPVFMLVLKMTIKVYKDRIIISFFPIMRPKTIYLKDIEHDEARHYKPIAEYGGWGIRISLKYGKAYNVSGDMGVQLVLKDGKNILIGSQRAEEFAQAITIAMSGK